MFVVVCCLLVVVLVLVGGWLLRVAWCLSFHLVCVFLFGVCFVCGVLFVGRCLLFVVRCTLCVFSVVCCVLFRYGGFLCAVDLFLFVVRCSFSLYVVRCWLFMVRCALFVGCSLLLGVCCCLL